MNALTWIFLVAAMGMAPAIALPSDAQQASSAAAQLDQLRSTLRRAHTSGDTVSYLGTAQTMYSFLNGSPRAMLQLMSAESFAGKQDDALYSFAQFVIMGQANDEALRAAQYDPLRTLPKFQAILRDMAANTSSVSNAVQVFRLKSSVPVPEDIDYDPAAKRFYLSSVMGKNIVAVDMTGQVTAFAQAPDQWPVMALRIDPARSLLWATEVALNGFALVSEKDWGRSAVLLYDLHSGRLLHRIEGPPQAALGDMTLDLNGDAIVSDGEHGGVYRVNRKTLGLERIDAGDFVSPQTPVVLPGGKHILVPDYVRGIGVLDLADKHVAWIRMEGKHALSGIDGLYASGNMLIATQNGTFPERVVRFALDASNTRVLSESIIERATATLGDPTHGVVVDGYFYYIANSGWDSLDDHGVLKEGKSLSAPLIMRAKL
ncbi:MAG TPA: hypothetical protein VE058_10560 [Steroidobacteraceae bacterium]|nr:hypothetical protein [Steroidobacteraceae bacterium]